MSRRLKLGVAAFVLTTLAPAAARAAAWKTNVNYGASTPMDLYVPDGVTGSPAVVVSLHYCGGTAANAHGWFQSYADTSKFLIIAPKSAGSCFDAGLGRSGERADIVKMVQYVVTNNNADPKKVFAAGPSSGACMTHALLASYPDVFAGGSSLAGVPAGAWTGGGAYGWSAPASTTAQQWGDKVRNADPGFTGSRPRIQFWQGMGDTNLTYAQTYPAQVAQWTNVFGVTDADATKSNVPFNNITWARTAYKDCTGLVVVEANSGPSSVQHDLTSNGLWGDVVRFFGLAQGGTPVGSCGGTGGAGGASGAGGGAGGTTGAGGRGGSTGGTTGAGGRGGTGGTTGTAGTTGSAGRGGTTGAGGTTGSGGTTGTGGTGVSGTAGRGGTTGTAGTAGIAGTTGTAGTTGEAGTSGTAGTTGEAGTSGTAGTTGNGGTTGEAGTTGTGGEGGSGSAGSPEPGDGAGCACNVGSGGSGSAVALLFAMFGLARRRRTRAPRR